MVQQSRARKRQEFTDAFASVIPDVVSETYKVVPKDIKEKIKRVIDVWKQRTVFSQPVLDDIDSKTFSSGGAPNTGGGSNLLGGNLGGFGGPMIPPSLKQLTSLQKLLDDSGPKAESAYDPAVKEYTNLFESESLPAPPAYSKSLASLLSTLESTMESTKKSVGTRKEILSHLKTLVETNESKLENEQTRITDLENKISHTKETKTEVDSMLVSDQAPEDNEEAEMADAPTPPAPPQEEEKVEDGESSYNNDLNSLPMKHTMSNDEEYSPVADNIEAPAYSPLSSDDEGAERPSKKSKSSESVTEQPSNENSDSTGNGSGGGLEGLDPAVAQLLSTLAQGNGGQQQQNTE